MTDLIDSPALIYPDRHAELVPVFVYGTLRIGMGNYRWAQEAVKHAQEGATTKGAIYFVRSRWGYPVAKFDEEGTIIGDVLWFDPDHHTYVEVVDMEIGAGYEMREIEIQHDGKTQDCFGFHYLREPRGERIKSGDWKSEATSWRLAETF